MMSNPIKDAEVLQLFHEVLVDLCQVSLSESVILEKSFEILFALDELVSYGGFKEEVSLSDVKEFLLMDSANEKVQEIYRKAQEESESQKRKLKSQELDRERLKRLEAEKAFAKLAAQKQEALLPTSNMMMPQSLVGSSSSSATITGASSSSPGAAPVVDSCPRSGMKLTKKGNAHILG